ncbi:M48 family metallopeptidase [soil metagenome]
MGAVGLQTHIWANNTRSILLLAMFPVLLVGIIFGIQLVAMGLGVLPNSGGGLGSDLGSAGSMLGATIPLAIVIAGAWFAIAWFGNQAIIDAMTGARPVERKDQPELYNLMENLAISRGLKTPTLRIIETDALNAYASGLREGHYSVTVTRGLLNAMTRDELEAVLAHEMTHVINKDVRTMVIASIFAGIISVIAQLVLRGMFYVRGGGRRENKNAMPLILIGLVIAAVGYGLAIVIRLMLSRTREYVADAGSVELTKNPDAMISALRKIEGHSTLKAPDEVQGMFLDNQPDKEGIDSLFATHPSIEKRIAALVKYAGGRDLGPMIETTTTAVPVSYSTSVPVS